MNTKLIQSALRVKFVESEDRSSRCKLRILQIASHRGQENRGSNSRRKLQHDNRQTGNRRGQVKIERVHRTKSKSNKNKDNQMKPRTMVVKLHSYKDKIKFLRNASKLKDTNIFRNKNFSVETLNYWKELWIKTQKCVKKVNIIPSVPRNFC